MKLKELLFTGMDIVKETKHLLGRTELSRNMTDEELKADKIGINNTLRAVKVILDSDEHIKSKLGLKRYVICAEKNLTNGIYKKILVFIILQVMDRNLMEIR